MRNSFFLKRILGLLFTALLLWTIITSIVYGVIARPAFVSMKRNDLQHQVHVMADLASRAGLQLEEQTKAIVELSFTYFGSWTYLADRNSQTLYHIVPDSLSTDTKEEIIAAVRALSNKVIETERDHWQVAEPEHFEESVLIVSAPIWSQEIFDGVQLIEPRIIGVVSIMQPLNELTEGLRSLNTSLLIAALLVGIVLTIPVIFATRHIVKPLNRMRRSALAMTAGNFSMRADETGDNEIGDLGRAMNHLAQKLSDTISQLTHERNQLEQIIEGIAEGIVAVSRDGHVTQINSMVWRMFHRNPDYYSADRLLEQTELKPLFDTCLKTGNQVNKVLEIENSLINCLITPLCDNHGVNGAVGLFRDVTESVKLEQTRRDYVANVSHELRTPVTAMRGLLEPLSDGMVKREEDRKRYYGILMRETMRLSRLIDDMLELSRLQSGQSSVLQGPAHLEEMVADLNLRFELQAAEHGLNYTFSGPDKPWPLIWSNLDRTQQILVILFDNACKFTPEGGEVALLMQLTEDGCVLTIKDTGTGIKAEDLPYVFDRFFKADKAHNETGTGLGLSIAREIATQMGQVLSVNSAEGEGAEFSLKIPYARDIMKSERHLKDVFEGDVEEITGDDDTDENR